MAFKKLVALISTLAIAIAATLVGGGSPAAAASPNDYLYFGYSPSKGIGKIGRVKKDGSGRQMDIVPGNFSPVIALTVTPTHMYWIPDWGTGIARANLDGSGLNLNFVPNVLQGEGFWGLAVSGSHIYWSSTEGKIGRANLNGTGVNKNFKSIGKTLFGLTVSGSHLYWAAQGGGPGTASIGRSNLDGSGTNLNLVSGIDAPYALAVTGSNIYWSNITLPQIGRASINGTGAKDKFIDPSAQTTGVAVSNSHIYWSGTNGKIGRSNLNGSGIDLNFSNGFPGMLTSLALMGTASSPKPTKVQKLTVKGKPSASVFRFKWKAPKKASQQGITGYRLTIKQRGKKKILVSKKLKKSQRAAAIKRSAIIKALKSSRAVRGEVAGARPFIVTVRATNAAGQGKGSSKTFLVKV